MSHSVSAGSSLNEAARALATGAPLRALSLVGRVEGALGMTLRGIAYAQMGDLELATESLERAVALADDPRTRARARAALVEIALGTDDPASAARAARAAAEELRALGDDRNAALMQLTVARAEVLLGRLAEARHVVSQVVSDAPDLRALVSLARAEIAIRSVAATEARAALEQARAALELSPHPILAHALDALEAELSRPIARLQRGGDVTAADLFAIEIASSGEQLLVDDCRLLVRAGRATIPLARRPVLFALLLVLARAYPSPVPRDELAARAFGVRRVNESHRSRLRVEIGRLRKLMTDLAAEPVATKEGYALTSERDVIVLLPPADGDAARIALLLGDGALWSARGLAEHAGVSQRTAERALRALTDRGEVVRMSKGRYARPGAPIASRMLLLGLLPAT